jgi:hypothetical protein
MKLSPNAHTYFLLNDNYHLGDNFISLTIDN